MNNYEKLEIAMFYVADIKYVRLLYSLWEYLHHKAEKDMTDKEKLELGAACAVGAVIIAIIYTLMRLGIMFALLFIGIMLFVCIFAKPITLIIKK